MPLLFSYGTLRDPAVQQATFGRELAGRPELILGYRLEMLEITDPHVIELSGETSHPMLVATDDLTDTVTGSVLELTDAELAEADGYEVADYRRVEARLASGDATWV